MQSATAAVGASLPFANEAVAPEANMYVGATETVGAVATETGTMSSYVRLRGLPFVATEQEVAQWFAQTPGAPIAVNRVLFTYNTTGRKSGEAVRIRLRPLPATKPAHRPQQPRVPERRERERAILCLPLAPCSTTSPRMPC